VTGVRVPCEGVLEDVNLDVLRRTVRLGLHRDLHGAGAAFPDEADLDAAVQVVDRRGLLLELDDELVRRVVAADDDGARRADVDPPRLHSELGARGGRSLEDDGIVDLAPGFRRRAGGVRASTAAGA